MYVTQLLVCFLVVLYFFPAIIANYVYLLLSRTILEFIIAIIAESSQPFYENLSHYMPDVMSFIKNGTTPEWFQKLSNL